MTNPQMSCSAESIPLEDKGPAPQSTDACQCIRETASETRKTAAEADEVREVVVPVLTVTTTSPELDEAPQCGMQQTADGQLPPTGALRSQLPPPSLTTARSSSNPGTQSVLPALSGRVPALHARVSAPSLNQTCRETQCKNRPICDRRLRTHAF